MANLCKLLTIFLILGVKFITGAPNDGNVRVWNYLQTKSGIPNLGEQDSYTINTIISGQKATIDFARRPTDHSKQLNRWGITITDSTNKQNVIQATVEANNRGMINQVDKSPLISGTDAMNAITKLFCDVAINEAGLHDMAFVPHHTVVPPSREPREALSLLQAYKGNGYSWYNKWKFFTPNDPEHAASNKLINDIKELFKTQWSVVKKEITTLHKEGKNGVEKDVHWAIDSAYNKVQTHGKYDGRWNNQKVGDVMFAVWRRRTWEEYEFMKKQLMLIPKYADIERRIEAAKGNLDNGPPYVCPGAQYIYTYHNDKYTNYHDTFGEYGWLILNILGWVFGCCCTVIALPCLCGAGCGIVASYFVSNNDDSDCMKSIKPNAHSV